jgi:hypothetical protein
MFYDLIETVLGGLMRCVITILTKCTGSARRRPDDDRRRLRLHDDAVDLHDLLGHVAQDDEPAGGRPGEAEDHLHAAREPLLHDGERGRPLVGRPLRLPPAPLPLRPVGDDAEAEARPEVGAAFPHPAPPRRHGLPRRDDRQPGRRRLPGFTLGDAEDQEEIAVS